MVQYNPQCMSALNPHVRNVTEATFARYVLRAPLPVLVCFGARDCPGYRAMQPVLKRVAQAQAEHLQVAAMQIEREGLVAIQYGVELSPTLVVFHAGDAQGCVRGFVPEGLVQLFAEDVVRGSVHDYQIWSPVEKHFEDSVLVPLLESWNMAYQRQVSCQTGQAGTRKRGQVDFVMYAEAHGAPVALIESKRQIRNEQELRQAACQGASYAASLNVPAFAVAAPSGLWLYRSAAPARPVKHFSSLDIHRCPEQPKQFFMQICHEL